MRPRVKVLALVQLVGRLAAAVAAHADGLVRVDLDDPDADLELGRRRGGSDLREQEDEPGGKRAGKGAQRHGRLGRGSGRPACCAC